jgi:hypothetical protein
VTFRQCGSPDGSTRHRTGLRLRCLRAAVWRRWAGESRFFQSSARRAWQVGKMGDRPREGLQSLDALGIPWEMAHERKKKVGKQYDHGGADILVFVYTLSFFQAIIVSVIYW